MNNALLGALFASLVAAVAALTFTVALQTEWFEAKITDRFTAGDKVEWCRATEKLNPGWVCAPVRHFGRDRRQHVETAK